jgi:hypothetical protein
VQSSTFANLHKRALPGLQQAPCLAALSDDLLRGIFGLVWAGRPARPAAGEVQYAASLFNVCRCVRKALQAQPLPLTLDFSAARLNERQRAWLAAPVRVGCVQAVSVSDNEEHLWCGCYKGVLAHHGHSLLRLTGVPLRLLATLDQSVPPALDLSGLALTQLRVVCVLAPLLRHTHAQQRVWLAPGYWPQSLIQLTLLSKSREIDGLLGRVEWGTHSALRPNTPLPQLQSVVVVGSAEYCLHLDDLPLLRGLKTCPALTVGAKSVGTLVNDKERVRSIHLRAPIVFFAGARENAHESRLQLASIQSLCPPALQSATLEGAWAVRFSGFLLPPAPESGDGPRLRMALRALLEHCSDQFAFEVCVQPCTRDFLQRLAWRRWPRQGSPEWQAAADAHAQAAAWAHEA